MRSLRSAERVAGFLEELQVCIPEWMAEFSVPGLSAAFVRGGEMLAEMAFGVRCIETQEPVTQATYFEAASLTKPMVACLALQLCAQGLMELDRPLACHLSVPYLPDDARSVQITLRHVLSHSTGFPNWRKASEPLRTHFEPGNRFSYSGEGFVYLSHAIEEILGQPLADALRTRIIEPIGLQECVFTWEDGQRADVAVGHNARSEPQAKRAWPLVNPAASLHCSSRDFARFMRELMRALHGESPLLHVETTRGMFHRQVPVNGLPPWSESWPDGEVVSEERVGWGLGWGIQIYDERDWIWHWGDNGCYRAFALGTPESGDGVVILTNSENGQRVIRPILEAIAGPNLPALDWLDRIYGITS